MDTIERVCPSHFCLLLQIKLKTIAQQYTSFLFHIIIMIFFFFIFIVDR